MTPDQLNRIADSAAAVLFGDAGGRLFSFLVSLGVLASLSAYLLTGPRVIFAMAHDRLLPDWLGGVDAIRQIPIRATVFLGSMALILLWSGSFQELLE